MATATQTAPARVIPLKARGHAPGSDDDAPPATEAGGAAELNLRILWPLGQWLLDHRGEPSLRRAAEAGGITPEALDGRTRWASVAQVEAFLVAAREAIPDDATFVQACAWRMAESYGAYRHALWAVSPRAVYGQGARAMRLISRVSRYELVEDQEGLTVWRYVTERPESRLLCLSRQAQMKKLPTLWGMPEATVEETACVAHGDDHCEYRIHYYVAWRWLPGGLGFLGGLLAAAVATGLGVAALPLWASLPLLGAAGGFLMELRRINRVNLGLGAEMQDALLELARDDSDARSELLALQQRQQAWTRVLEAQVAERTAMLQRMVDKIQRIRTEREATLRGFSHDLRNPLAVLRAGTGLLAEHAEVLGADGPELVADMESSMDRMERMLREAMDVAEGRSRLLNLVPERLVVAELPEQLRRRLQALVLGRDIRVTAFSTREAPEAIESNPLLFDRVVDNLLTNAAKYTERGSIVVEVGGRPGALVLKVSDTGRGIADEALHRIFQPGGSTERAPGSWGVGLSVVVELLSQVGGRLEVMSRPGVGTTFWAHIPEHLAPQPDSGDPIDQVVTIRRNDTP